jgi:hypothetical protein
MKKTARKALLFVNILGALGYFTMVLAWALFIAALLLLLAQSSVISLPSGMPSESTASLSVTDDAVFLRIIGYLITIIMAVLTLGIVLLLPYFLGSWGAKTMRRLLAWFRVVETRRHLFFVKCFVIIAPLIGFIIINLFHEPIDMTIPAAHVATIVLSLVSLGSFLLQLGSARSLNIGVRDMW